MKNKPFKLNKDRLLQDLKSDYKAAQPGHNTWVAKRDEYIAETYGKPYGNEVKGSSQIVSKDIKRQLEWLIPSITDPFLGTPDVIKCNPVTFEDSNAARQNELLLNTQFTRQFDRYNFITRAARVLATEGTCVVQCGWEYEDKKVVKQVETIVVDENGQQHISVVEKEDTEILVNKPTAKVCRGEDIYIDPTCMGDLDKAQFVIYRYETDLSTLRKDGRYKNLKRVAAKLTDTEDIDYRPEDATYFKFSDVARKKVVIYEYWGNYDMYGKGITTPIVCTWAADDIIIRLEGNPYPDKQHPFLVVPFTPIPFQLQGEALAENIGDRQKIKTAITRGMIENMAKSNNGQVAIREGSLSMANKKRFREGKNFEFRGSPNDFWQGSYNQIPSSAFNMLQLMDNDIESQTGVKSFSGGVTGNSLGSTATGTRAVQDATGMRKLNLIRNIAENLLKPLMRKWMAYNAEFLDEETVIRVTNEQFVPIRRDDLEGKIDIDIEISTVEDNNAKAQQLSFMLQTIGPALGAEFTQLILEDIARLQKMPELAEKIKNYQPKQDPNAEQAKQLEMQKLALENERLKGQIQELNSKVQIMPADGHVKEAKARLDMAKAEQLGSAKDLIDLQFLKENTNIDHQNKLELEELKGKLNLLSMQQQQQAGDKQLGVYGG